MGWRFEWVSSLGSDFDFDFGTSATEEQQRDGAELSYFGWVDEPLAERGELTSFAALSDDGGVYHTYSGAGRDDLAGRLRALDRAPRGRDEDALPFPMAWWRRHDNYESARTATA